MNPAPIAGRSSGAVPPTRMAAVADGQPHPRHLGIGLRSRFLGLRWMAAAIGFAVRRRSARHAVRRIGGGGAFDWPGGRCGVGVVGVQRGEQAEPDRLVVAEPVKLVIRNHADGALSVILLNTGVKRDISGHSGHWWVGPGKTIASVGAAGERGSRGIARVVAGDRNCESGSGRIASCPGELPSWANQTYDLQ